MGREPLRRGRIPARCSGPASRPPRCPLVVRDWLAKLQLVSAGLAITTVPGSAARAVPPGIHLLTVRGEPQELRRAVLARLPGAVLPAVDAVADALHAAA